MRKASGRDPTKAVKGWFITRHEPTADQRGVLAQYQNRIVACSYDGFHSRLIDARTYLQLRDNYPYGSLRDPKTGRFNNNLHYVPLNLVDLAGDNHKPSDIARELATGNRFLLTGDYGAGKSSTGRAVARQMAQSFWNSETRVFPVMLNLRDHHGQTEPEEALERHARKIGFPSPSALVRAWRAGFCTLLLDGFDEIAVAAWGTAPKNLRRIRQLSMELAGC